jgi:hypothetical protein
MLSNLGEIGVHGELGDRDFEPSAIVVFHIILS